MIDASSRNRQPFTADAGQPDHASAGRQPRWIAAVLSLCVPIVGLAQTPGNAYSYSRTSSFTYNTTTGLLASETVEPNNLQSCVVTTYGYDAYGNKTTATIGSCAVSGPNAELLQTEPIRYSKACAVAEATPM